MLVPVLKRVGLGVGLATLLVVVIGLFLPRNYTISRSVVVDASRERVHELCTNLEEWPRWTPWFRADPDLAITLGDITRGAGAHQSWTSSKGRGELTFVRANPDRGVDFDLVLNQGDETMACTMRYSDVADGLQVTWELVGDHGYNLAGRYVGLLMDMLVGPMFDEGLARLKLVAEEAPADSTGDMG